MPQIAESTYPQGPVLVDGYYPATLTEVNEYTKTYEGRESTRLAWIFAVEAGEDAVDDSVEIEDPEYVYDGYFEIAAHTGGKRSTKSNSNWFKLDMDGFVPEGIKDTNDVLGAKCTVNVSSYTHEDGTVKNTIEKIRPPKTGKGSGKKTAQMKAQEEAEATFADLDF